MIIMTVLPSRVKRVMRTFSLRFEEIIISESMAGFLSTGNFTARSAQSTSVPGSFSSSRRKRQIRAGVSFGTFPSWGRTGNSDALF